MDQQETWLGYEETMDAFASFLQEKGPYDGWVGFDEGGTIMLQAATRAQQGDPKYVGMVRFMVLLTTYLPMELSPLRALKPSAPLKIPTFISWSDSDTARPFCKYEEVVLYVDENYREVCRHQDGHKPPRMAPGVAGFDQLKEFMRSMRYGLKWQPSESHENKLFRNMWLPITREPPPLPTEGSRKKLLVFHDPSLGKHVRASLESLGAARPFSVARLQLYADVTSVGAELFSSTCAKIGSSSFDVEGVGYTEDHQQVDFSTSAHSLASPLDPHDVIQDGQGNDHTAKARQIAKEICDDLMTGDTVYGIVGIGHGAFIALQAARELVARRNLQLAGLWVAAPPTIMPASVVEEGPGVLLNCPLHVLVPQTAKTGSSWRWAVQTLGPFSFGLFKDTESLAKVVLSEFESRLFESGAN